MSLLSKVTKGKNERAPKLLIAGTAGVGKSTFASGADSVLFVESENRTDHLDISRLKLTRWPDVFKIFEELPSSEYKTVVFDTVDAMELLIFEHLCELEGVANHEEIGGGFAKYRAPLLQEWKKFINWVDNLTQNGIQVILIAHTHVKTFIPPGGSPYDRWTLKMDARSSDFLIENVDLVGFAHFQTFTKESKNKTEKAKVTTTNKRLLDFKYNPAYPTKQGIPVKDKCPLEWDEYQKALDV